MEDVVVVDSKALQQARRAFDVCEHEGDGPGRQLAHHFSP
jgi:hypothetical protein